MPSSPAGNSRAAMCARSHCNAVTLKTSLASSGLRDGGGDEAISASAGKNLPTEIMLLYVVEPRTSLTLEDEDDLRGNFLDHYGALIHRAHVRLGQLLATLAAYDIPSQGAVAYGRRGETLLRIARETGADLIILPPMGSGAQHNGAGAAPVRAEVAACARCPVLLLAAE
jgi:nucleotide-binding universal stress UspA family protein